MVKKDFNSKFWDEPDNNFRKSLNNGEFHIFFEVNIPEVDCNIKTALSRCRPYVNAVEKIKDLNCGITISNGMKYKNVFNVIDFTSRLDLADINKHVVFISGRGKDREKIAEHYAAAVRVGIKNIVPVTGEFSFDDNPKNLQNINFFESVRALSILKNYFDDVPLFPGGVINPFKYTPIDLYPQYFNLMKKIKMGANFLFTQTGWDLLKFQELRWYLEKRNLYIPTIAKLYFLKPDYIENVISGKMPGVRISPDFLGILRKESKFGLTQFMSAQWRKFQLMLAGVKFMGYSGVTIAGLENSSEVEVAHVKIKEAYSEFTSFEEWKMAYVEYMGRAEMAPYPYRYYMYKNLFDEPYADNAKETFIKVPECTKKEKLYYNISSRLWNKKLKMGKKSYLKKMIYRCGSCDEDGCSLDKLFFVCYKKCPKKNVNGPCGDTCADGTCEISEKECAFGKIFRIANWKNNIYRLEEDIY
jgi:methylenetetrahydrofolate reductase (NADPH)